MEQNLMARQFDSIDREDPYSMLKQDFSNIFFKHNLDNFTNPSDIGFLNIDKTYMDSFPNHYDDHATLLDSTNPQALRIAPQRDELHHTYQDALLNSTYSPMGRSHHGPGHFNQGMNPNLAYNSMKQQPFQQDHPRYPGYHPQGYHYSNQYDAHMMQHDASLDYYYHPQDMMDSHNDDPLSLMWSEDPSKAVKMKNASYGQDAKPKMSSGYAGYEQDHNGDKYFNSYSDIKGGHMAKMHDLSRVPIKKEPESHYKETYNFSSGINKSQKFNSRPSPERKPTESYFDDDDGNGDDFDGDSKGRSTRGLRVLSLKVKEIVGQKKRTSYKEVAETLTIELRQKTGGARSAKEDSKDEQNVKRRVYDALNVLIAAGVLRKEGKLVYCDELMANNGAASKRSGNGNKDKLLADIQEARRRNKAKIEMLHELIFKFLAIKNLVKTNKEKLESEGGIAKNRTANVSATRIDVVQENPALKPKNEDVIRFPFIVLLSSSPENSMNINMDTLQKQLAIESKKPFNIFGDIDVLLKMGLHYVTKKMFDENIPLDLQRYAPKYYVAALK